MRDQSTYQRSSEVDSKLRDLFAFGAQVWRPSNVPSAAQMIYAPFSFNEEVADHCEQLLCDDERLQAARFTAARDRALFVQRRAFRRYSGGVALGSKGPLTQIQFVTSEKGRPMLVERPDIWFSFSSCSRGMLAAWSTTHALGVDIEDQTKTVEAREIAEAFFTPAEARLVHAADESRQQQKFFQLWCLKEAALKSIGEGLPFGLDRFRFELEPEPKIVEAPRSKGGPHKFSAYLVEFHECCASVVIRCLGGNDTGARTRRGVKLRDNIKRFESQASEM